jgi:hypothetical protein
MNFRVYYDDGGTFDGVLDDVPNTPTIGVQVIVQYDPHSSLWYTQHGADNYLWKEDRWVGGDDTARTVYLVRDGMKKVLFGETIRNQAYRDVLKRACKFVDELSASGAHP